MVHRPAKEGAGHHSAPKSPARCASEAGERRSQRRLVWTTIYCAECDVHDHQRGIGRLIIKADPPLRYTCGRPNHFCVRKRSYGAQPSLALASCPNETRWGMLLRVTRCCEEILHEGRVLA